MRNCHNLFILLTSLITISACNGGSSGGSSGGGGGNETQNYYFAAGTNTTGNNSIFYSSDGLSWSEESSPIPATSIATNGNILVAITKQNQIYISSDGFSWSQASYGTCTNNVLSANNITKVQYLGGNFFVYGNSGKVCYYNTATSQWDTTTNTIATYNINQLAYNGNGTYVAATNGGLYTTADPISSSWASSQLGDAYQGVAYGNGYFVAIPRTSGQPLYSSDGSSWSLTTGTFSSNSAIAFGNNTFVAGGGYNLPNNSIAYLANPVTDYWMQNVVSVSGSTSSQVWSAMNFANGTFFASNLGGVFAVSTDGISWFLPPATNNYYFNNVVYK